MVSIKRSLTFEEVKQLINKKFPSHRIFYAFETNNAIVCSIVEKSKKSEDAVDCMFSVDKETKKIKEYIPWENRAEFRECVKNRVLYSE